MSASALLRRLHSVPVSYNQRTSATTTQWRSIRRRLLSTSSKPQPAEGGSQQSNESPKGDIQGPVTWKGLGIAALLGTGGLIYYSREREKRMKEIMSPKTVGRASIGGPFQLINGQGKPFTQHDLEGRWTLVYFGFTMCPDICPEEMTKLAEALQIIEKRGYTVSAQNKPNDDSVITPIFISIDPERDSPQRAADYCKAFHPAFVGVSGSLEQVTDAAKKYRVYFSKDETPGDDYLVDHSIITYFMDPDGEFQEFYGKNASAVEIASRMETTMLGWSSSHNSKSAAAVAPTAPSTK